MSKRPREAKKIARLRKLLRRTPPAHINLIEYLKDRGHAQTTGHAKRLLIDGRVRHESHIIGREKNGDDWVADPVVHAELRNGIVVLP